MFYNLSFRKPQRATKTIETNDILVRKDGNKIVGITILGERGYYCLGKSAAGRYIFVFFILKQKDKALIISARDMTPSERRYYERK